MTSKMEKERMTREELQLRLQELNKRKEELIKGHDGRLMEIHEKQQKSIAYLQDRKFRVLNEIVEERRKVDAAMRQASMEEQTRYKLECARLENERQTLFADYKAQGSENGGEKGGEA